MLPDGVKPRIVIANIMSPLAIFFLLVGAPALAVYLAFLGWTTLPTNPLGWFLLLVGGVYSLATAFTAVFRRERFWEAQDSAGALHEERGDRSFWLVTLAMAAVFFLSPLEYVYLPAWLGRNAWTEICGVGLVVAGAALFVWARRTLGANFSGHVSVMDRHVLVQSGPYGIIRHPAYTGYFLMAAGIGVGYSSLAGLSALIGFLMPGLAYRARVEDRLLAAHFGGEWQAYTRRVPAFFPRLGK